MDKLELKADISISDDGIITGIAWPYNAGADRAGDIITKGAIVVPFLPLPMLLGHDPEQPIGLWQEVTETPDGLQVEGRLFIDESARARAVFGAIKGGLISGLSIAFSIQKATKRGINRVIEALTLKEVSVVRNPAHPRARVTGTKDASAAIVDAINRATAALRRSS